MKRTLLSVALILGVATSLAATQSQRPAPPPNLTGKWVLSLEMSQGTATPALELKQDGEKLTGRYIGRYGAFDLTGTLKARAIQFGFTMQADGEPVRMTFTGEVAADAQSMKGRATLGELGDAAWTARRDKTGER
jgi:hypothetical protein